MYQPYIYGRSVEIALLLSSNAYTLNIIYEFE